MKKVLITAVAFAGLFFSANTSKAQLLDEKDVTVTMDLQPILQLDMTTSDQLEFIFDDIRDYYSGIIKYAGTILKVSSTVTWDLYAVGTSTTNAGGGAAEWDFQVSYSSNAANPNSVNNLPLSLLELHQTPLNPANVAGPPNGDYSTPFSSATSAAPPIVATASTDNSLYYDAAGINTPPLATGRYIAGDAGTTAVGTDGVDAGSYLVNNTGGPFGFAGAASSYYYVIDYRILPGLPAVFPNASSPLQAPEDLRTVGGGGSEFAEPGVYTMNVKYILLEDQ